MDFPVVAVLVLLALAVIALLLILASNITELDAKDAVITELTVQRDDWKGKAERLIDANLARAGAIHQPTMEQRKAADRVTGAASMMAASLAITEIDSGRKQRTS